MEATSTSGKLTLPQAGQSDLHLRKVSKQLESSFLSEMLKSTGLGKAPEAFGGGEGEDQFSSFLISAQADAIVEAGGIGLAESIFYALKGKENE